LILWKTIMATSGERVLSMWSLNRNRILGMACSPVAFGVALLAVTLLAATALTRSSQAPISLADFASAICSQRFQSTSETEASYLAENVSAMTKMMSDMGVRPSGDIDRDFVAMMTPHHQGAIAMARAELRYGRNEQLKRMAQEIIVTQLEEIAAMRLAVSVPLSVASDAALSPSRADPKRRVGNSSGREQ
jgi:hypothetical protein